MNVESNNIMNVMEELCRVRDDSIFPQNLNIYLAKTTTDDNKLSKLPTKTGNQPRYTPRVMGEISGPSPRKTASQNIKDSTSDQHKTANGTVKTSTHSSKLVTPKTNRSKEIATFVESQSSKLKLTPAERNVIITTILASELGLQSKLESQLQDIFSSPINDDTVRNKSQSKRRSPKRDETSFKEKQSPSESVPVIPAQTVDNQFPSNRSRQQNTNDRQSKRRTKRSLTPIPEVSEVPFHEVENEGSKTKDNLEALRAQERLRQQHMESDLPSNLIQDTDASMLVRSSDESDSLDELVIKDFAIRVAQSEPDASLTALPVTEQALIESKKLATTIDALKERFQIKIAREKHLAHHEPKNLIPEVQRATNRTPSTHPTEGRTMQKDTNPYINSLRKYFKTNKEPMNNSTTITPPINIIDSTNWGEVALPEPIPIQRDVSESEDLTHVSSNEESFLNEKDMQFDDLFEMDNVTPPFLSSQRTQQQQLHQNVDQRSQQTRGIRIDSIENIEDFENPQLSDLPSDESDQTSSHRFNEINVSVNENIENLEDPQFRSDTSDEIITDSAIKPPQHEFRNEIVPEQSHNNILSVDEQHESDTKRLKELLNSGALTSSITDQRFEEGVLDLLLRQSDSLWDPVVSGIPITYFIPSRNHEKVLLDTSINESNLDTPLIKSPQKKLPEYLESLENEWTVKTKKNVEPNILIDTQDDENQLIHGLPEFSYEPVPQYLYRRSVHNIMDSEDEPEDSYNILEDEEMNFDDLINNVAEPNYDFKKANLLDALEWKIKFLRDLKKDCEQTKTPDPPTVSHKINTSGKLKTLGSYVDPRDIFNKSHQRFNAVFGIEENGLTHGKYVPPTDIELLYKNLPLIDSQIIRNVHNCQHHLQLMESIYKKIYKYTSQVDQPQSLKTSDLLEKIIVRFNQVIDGRICARIQTCPMENFESPKSQNKKTTSPNRLPNQMSDSRKGQVKEQQQNREVNAQKPVKMTKSVSFAESSASSKTSKSEKTGTKPVSTRTVGRKKVERGNSARPSSKGEKRASRSETSGADNGEFNAWTSLNISEVKDLIEQARTAQKKYGNQRKVKTSV